VFAFVKVNVLGEITECKNVKMYKCCKNAKSASDTNVKESTKVE
jgi:hypothetical protein